MSRAPNWTAAEETTLIEMWRTGATKEAIAQVIGRTPAACQVKAYSIGMCADFARRNAIHGSQAFAPWSYEEADVFEFAKRWHGPGTIAEITAHYGRPAHSVKSHAVRLNLGPRRNPHPEFESLHWYKPVKPRLRLCYACDTRLPVADFDGPNDKTCRECAHPNAHVALDLPKVRDCWDPDQPIGGVR